MEPVLFTPIGLFHCQEKWPYDAPRQGILSGENPGYIELAPGMNYEQALHELDGFERVWVLFLFHKNSAWKPMIRPPRHREEKVGVFASRSPYRPNPIGLSCVRLQKIRGRKIFVTEHDLLDGTPVLDIKPYLPYADSFPDATAGWTEKSCKNEKKWQVRFSDPAKRQMDWLANNGVPSLENFIREQLSYEPLNGRRHRLYPKKKVAGAIFEGTGAVLAYRTWRIAFSCFPPETPPVPPGVELPSVYEVIIEKITSGYTAEELNPEAEDLLKDKELHRKFLALFP